MNATSTVVIAYTAWVLYRLPAFVAFSSMADYAFPPAGDMVIALGPAAAAGITGALSLPRIALTRARVLVAWAVIALALAVFHPLSITLQFLVGVGIPLVGLGALGAARWRPAATMATAALFATTAAVAMRIVVTDNGRWLVPAERVQAARALRGTCRDGDVALTPPDIGLYALAYAACHPFLAHVAAHDFETRDALARRFYADGPPDWRAAFLDAHCITHVVLAGDPGDVPAAWLGAGTAFRRTARIPGASAISVYARSRPPGCP